MNLNRTAFVLLALIIVSSVALFDDEPEIELELEILDFSLVPEDAAIVNAAKDLEREATELLAETKLVYGIGSEEYTAVKMYYDYTMDFVLQILKPSDVSFEVSLLLINDGVKPLTVKEALVEIMVDGVILGNYKVSEIVVEGYSGREIVFTMTGEMDYGHVFTSTFVEVDGVLTGFIGNRWRTTQIEYVDSYLWVP